MAKAFALRDKPGSIRVPGLRPGAEAGGKNKEARRAQASRTGSGVGGRNAAGAGWEKRPAGEKRSRDDNDFDVPQMTDEQEARKKMRMKMRAMGGASEFNLG